jgi:hypothetical protein
MRTSRGERSEAQESVTSKPSCVCTCQNSSTTTHACTAAGSRKETVTGASACLELTIQQWMLRRKREIERQHIDSDDGQRISSSHGRRSNVGPQRQIEGRGQMNTAHCNSGGAKIYTDTQYTHHEHEHRTQHTQHTHHIHEHRTQHTYSHTPGDAPDGTDAASSTSTKLSGSRSVGTHSAGTCSSSTHRRLNPTHAATDELSASASASSGDTCYNAVVQTP